VETNKSGDMSTVCKESSSSSSNGTSEDRMNLSSEIRTGFLFIDLIRAIDDLRTLEVLSLMSPRALASPTPIPITKVPYNLG